MPAVTENNSPGRLEVSGRKKDRWSRPWKRLWFQFEKCRAIQMF